MYTLSPLLCFFIIVTEGEEMEWEERKNWREILFSYSLAKCPQWIGLG